MNRRHITVALTTAAGLAAGHLLRQRRWSEGLHNLAAQNDATHLRGLRTAGMLSRSEATQVALWSRAYPPGVLTYALAAALTAAHPADLPAIKRAFLTGIAAQIGPHLPTHGHLTLPAL